MAMIRGVLTREADGKLISTSEHHLVNNDKGVAKLQLGLGFCRMDFQHDPVAYLGESGDNRC